MKKLLLSALFVGAMFTAQAQTNLAGTAATTRAVLSMSASEISRQMYNDLKLNEGQYIKIKALNQTRIDRYSEVERMYSNDTQMRDSKIKEIDSQLDEQFASILSPEQFTAYIEMGRRPGTTTAPAEGTTNSGGPVGTASVSTSATSSTSTNMGTAISADSTTKGNVTKYKKGDMEQKMKPGEQKVKVGDRKVKSEEGKMKIEDGDNKTKIESDKMKMESASGEMKVKDGVEKLKTDSVRYKSSENETKIKTADGKTKMEPNKVKTKTDTTKKKVKN